MRWFGGTFIERRARAADKVNFEVQQVNRQSTLTNIKRGPHMRIHAYIIGTAVTVASLFCGAVPAFAHAQLRSVTPAAGSTVQTTPAEVVLNFSESLEPAFSSLAVHDGAGKRVDKADSHLDQNDKTTMRVSLPPLGKGTYTVEWRAVSSDTHRVNGKFTFRVSP